MMLSLTESVFDLRSKGVRMVIQNNLFQAIFHILGSILYNANIEEQEQWAPGEYSLATFNFGSLSNHDTFSDIFFNDPYFGTHRGEFLKSVESGCDYCFWMIHYRFPMPSSLSSLNLILLGTARLLEMFRYQLRLLIIFPSLLTPTLFACLR